VCISGNFLCLLFVTFFCSSSDAGDVFGAVFISFLPLLASYCNTLKCCISVDINGNGDILVSKK